MVKVAVVGAGIMGLSTAYYLKILDPSMEVTILSKTASPHTCTDVAAGLWEPFLMRDTPIELQRKWSKATWDHMEELFTRRYTDEVSILKMPVYNLEDKEIFELPWKDFVPDMRVLTKEELKMFPDKYKSGFCSTAYILEPTKYLKWLTKRFVNAGGSFETKELGSLDELAGSYDVVVNCTGMGARWLCNDESVEPVRGQVIRVKAPWIDKIVIAVFEGKVAYIIPNSDTVVLGGTKQQGNFSKEINLDDKNHILRETLLIEPRLKDMVHVRDAVGLRPSRPSVRLEREDMEIKRADSKKTTTLRVVHNYGHGGAGITVHWGCAIDAAKLVMGCIADLKIDRPIQSSKL